MIVDSSKEHHQDDNYQMDASKDGRLAALGISLVVFSMLSSTIATPAEQVFTFYQLTEEKQEVLHSASLCSSVMSLELIPLFTAATISTWKLKKDYGMPWIGRF